MASISHRQILGFVWKYAKRHLWMIAAMLVMMITATTLTLIEPFFFRNAVDLISQENVGDREVWYQASLFILYGVLLGVVSLTLHECSSYLVGLVELRVMRAVHADVFAHVQRLSTKFHVNTFAGATSRKIRRGVDGVEVVIDKIWFNFLPLTFFTIGLTIVLTLYAPLVGLAMISGIFVYAVISIYFGFVFRRYHSWVDEQDTLVTASIVDSITGNPAVKTFVAEVREDVRHGHILTELQHRMERAWKFGNAITWIQFMLLKLIELSALLLAVYLWYRGAFTAGGFIVVIFYMGQLWGRLHDIGRNVRDYLRNIAHCEEMVELRNQSLEIEDAPDATVLTVAKGAIAFENVHFQYGDYGTPLFEDFSLDIKPGEKVALVGHSGSGKTTLTKLLMRLYDVTGGAIYIDGKNISKVTQESLRQSMSLVPQDPTLFHRSIAENIAYARPEASRRDIEDASRKSHAHEFIAELPQGYDTLVGERGVKLSGGERQRVAIARAILADKPILILDEATSSLDSVSEKFIQEALEYLMKDRTTIIIAHRLGTVRSANRIAVLDKGKRIAFAPHEELMKTCDGYREMVELQSHGLLAE